MNEDFITTDKERGYIERVGKDYIRIKDIETGKSININADSVLIEAYRDEFNSGETIYVCYDSVKKIIL